MRDGFVKSSRIEQREVDVDGAVYMRVSLSEADGALRVEFFKQLGVYLK